MRSENLDSIIPTVIRSDYLAKQPRRFIQLPAAGVACQRGHNAPCVPVRWMSRGSTCQSPCNYRPYQLRSELLFRFQVLLTFQLVRGRWREQNRDHISVNVAVADLPVSRHNERFRKKACSCLPNSQTSVTFGTTSKPKKNIYMKCIVVVVGNPWPVEKKDIGRREDLVSRPATTCPRGFSRFPCQHRCWFSFSPVVVVVASFERSTHRSLLLHFFFFS